MLRTAFTCCLASLFLAAVADAHFVFIVPNKDGTSAQVVFSDDLNPDERVPITKIASTKLSLSTGGKPSKLDWKKEKHSLSLEIPGKGTRIVQGTTDYGVMQKEGDKPYLLRYHPRAVVGSAKELKPDATLPVEIVPVVDGGKVRFLVASKGKPLAEAEVALMLPGDKKQKAKTDSKGLTESFDATGRYAAWTRHSEKASGKLGEKAYEEIRHYATLVFDLPAK